MLPVSGQGWSITGMREHQCEKSVNTPSWVFNHVTIAHLSKLTIRCLLITFSRQFCCSITPRVRDIVNEMTDSRFNSHCFFQFPSLLLALAMFFTIPYVIFHLFPFSFRLHSFFTQCNKLPCESILACCHFTQIPFSHNAHYSRTRWMLHSEKAIFTLVCCLIIRVFLIWGRQTKKNQYRC